MGRTGTKWVEMLPNRYNVSKWVECNQMALYGQTCYKMGEMLPKWVDMLLNGKKCQ